MSIFISEDLISLIKDRVSVYDIVSQHVALKQKGKDYLGLCPFHKEKTPSFTVNTQKNFYHCFGCGAHGDIFSFLTEHSKLSFPEAIETCANLAGIKLQQQTPQQEAEIKARNTLFEALQKMKDYWHQKLNSNRPNSFIHYLHKRGITDASISKFQLGAALKGETIQHLQHHNISSTLAEKCGLLTQNANKIQERFINRLVFPIFDAKNRVVGFGGRTLSDDIQPKYLNSPETSVFHKSKLLYGLHLLNVQHDQGIIVEGYLDVIALNQAGFQNVFAPMGTALATSQAELLIKHLKTIHFAFDGDPAGLKAAMRTVSVMLPLLKPGINLQFIILPPNEDPHSIVTQKSAQAFTTLLNKSLDVVEFMQHYENTLQSDTSPPAQALKRKNILDKLTLIEDQYLKSLYKNKLYELFKPKKHKALNHATKLPQHVNITNLYERILLKAIIKKPEIYQKLIEDISLENLSAECLAITNVIETYFLSTEALEFLDIVPYIKSRVPTFNIDQLLAENLHTHAPFLKDPIDVLNATASLRKILQMLNNKGALELHIKEAQERFQQTQSAEDWERLKQLIAEKDALAANQTNDN